MHPLVLPISLGLGGVALVGVVYMLTKEKKPAFAPMPRQPQLPPQPRPGEGIDPVTGQIVTTAIKEGSGFLTGIFKQTREWMSEDDDDEEGITSRPSRYSYDEEGNLLVSSGANYSYDEEGNLIDYRASGWGGVYDPVTAGIHADVFDFAAN